MSSISPHAVSVCQLNITYDFNQTYNLSMVPDPNQM